jgi:hypothetical protein
METLNNKEQQKVVEWFKENYDKVYIKYDTNVVVYYTDEIVIGMYHDGSCNILVIKPTGYKRDYWNKCKANKVIKKIKRFVE